MWAAVLVIPAVLFWQAGGSSPTLRRSRRASALVLTLVLLAMFGVAAGIMEWRGGWTVGPRYLAGAPPTAAFASALVLQAFASRGPGWRSLVRGVAGGLAIASVLSIGLVGLVYDTLPEALPRPLTQFALPFVYLGFVPHHVGEWFGWMSTFPWYLACVAMLAAVGVAVLLRDRESTRAFVFRLVCLVVAACAGLAPALTRPEDGTPVLGLHPSVAGLAASWEPPGRDRITLLREDAEHYGPRRPCMWYRLGDLDRIAGRTTDALRDEAHAKAPRADACKLDPYFSLMESLRTRR
jgi:hypothetical protein